MTLLAVAPFLLTVLGFFKRWVTEDAFIDFRVVQHLLSGHGPVYNLGERVEAYTNALWIAILTVAAAPLRPFLGERVPLEWIAVVLGLAGTVAGLVLAELGALRLARAAGRPGLAFPLGALAFALLPPAWSFATSGLETGLAFFWLGLCFWGAARPARPRWYAIVVGLGPLIRPDLAVYSAGFLLLALRRTKWAVKVRTVAAAAALPLAHQIFRMGYFAALVPNTAIAKEASAARWEQGFLYLKDFSSPYRLWIPLIAALVAVAASVHRRRGRPLAVALVTVACALVHAAYVARVGGDFMHGRMLLPAWFAVLLPAAMVASTNGRRARLGGLVAPALVIVPWAVVCGLWLRVPYIGPSKSGLGPNGIADERYYYSERIGVRWPVTLADYGHYGWVDDGRKMRALAKQKRVLLPWRPKAEKAVPGRQVEMELSPRVPSRVVSPFSHVGLFGYAAGTDVHVVDRLGLADAVAARIALARRGRPGHEKNLPDEWVVARFAAIADLPARPGARALEPKVSDARDALRCGDLAELLEATTAPLTLSRFARNVVLSRRLHGLRFPADPSEARKALCAKGG